MKNDQSQQFSNIMNTLGEIYGTKVTKTMIRMYWATLKNFSINQIEKATKNLLATKTFNKFPLPADFIQYLNPPENADAKSYEALKTVEDAFPDNGYTSLCFDDPLIHFVVDAMGGWIRVCEDTYNMSERDYNFWRKDFLKMYKAYHNSPPKREVPMLVGSHEQNNKNNGYLDDNNMLYLPGTQKKIPDKFIKEFKHKGLTLEPSNRQLLTPDNSEESNE